MKCAKCGEEMYLDDKDYNFKGNYDDYWCCPKCDTYCVEEVRFGQSYRELWHSENNSKVDDWVIKKKIVR